MVAQLCENPKNHWIIDLKWVDCVACELYFNKSVIKEIIPWAEEVRQMVTRNLNITNGKTLWLFCFGF